MYSNNILLCRLCMNRLNENKNDWVDLFSKRNNKEDLARLMRAIKSCYNIEIVYNDGLPTTVCQSCAEMLQTFYQAKIYVNGVNNSFHKTKNIDKLFVNRSSKSISECSEINEDEIEFKHIPDESDDDDRSIKDISSKIDTANILQKKRGKRKLYTDGKKMMTNNKIFKKKINNVFVTKIAKKRGRPLKYPLKDVTVPPATVIEPIVSKTDTAFSSEETSEPILSGKNSTSVENNVQLNGDQINGDKMDADSDICENEYEKRASSGRILKPVCRDDFVSN